MENNLEIDFKNLKIQHICYVYREPEKQAKMMESLFNMPKFEFSEILNHPAVYRGRDTNFSIKMGMSKCFNISIELYQWLEGDCIYKEFLDDQNEGLHHIGILVEDLQKYIDDFQKKGIGIIQQGIFPPVLSYAYLDTTKDFGIIVEFFEIVKRRKKK